MAFEWELTKESINLPLGYLQGGLPPGWVPLEVSNLLKRVRHAPTEGESATTRLQRHNSETLRVMALTRLQSHSSEEL